MKGVKTQLLSRQGVFLSVDREKGVKGIKQEDESTFFYLIPVGLRIVSIQHMESMLYIAMNSEGMLYASVSSSLNNSAFIKFLQEPRPGAQQGIFARGRR